MDSLEHIYSYCIIICGSLSTFGCLLIIVSGLSLKPLHTYTFRLIVYLSFADLLASISKNYSGFLIPGSSSTEACYIQAILQNYSQLVSLFITWVISYSLYEIVVNENFEVSVKEKRNILLSFFLPLLLTPLPLITRSYNDSNGWCWIGYESINDILWMILEFYGPWVLIIISNIFFYYKIYKNIRNETHHNETYKIMKKFLSRLRLYPFILILCFGPSFAHRIYYIVGGSDNSNLDLISGSLNALYGFFNTLVYGFTGKVRKSIKSVFSNKSPKKPLAEQ